MTKQIAEAWRPHLYLEVRSGADVLCALPPIEKINDRTWTYPDRVDHQPVYFKAMQGEGWKAVLYCFYFRNDPKGMHLHDLTGQLRFQRSFINPTDGIIKRAHMVSRQHHELFYEQGIRDGIAFTAGDHTPCPPVRVSDPVIDYGDDYPLVDLDSIDIEPYRKAFAPSVTFPDQWSCTRADAFLKQTPKGRELAKKLEIKSVRGLIVTAPDKLITVLESM